MSLSVNTSSRFEINPRNYPKDKVHLCGITLWALFVLGFVFIGIQHQLWVITSFGGLLFLIIPYILCQHNRGDILEVTDEDLIVSRTNPEKLQFKISRKQPLEITIEHVKSSNSIESTTTLNLWDTDNGFRRRTILGFWLSQEAKIKASKNLLDFLNNQGFTVNYRNDIE